MTHHRFFCLLCLSLALFQPSHIYSREWIELELGTGLIFPADEQFKAIYTDRLLAPELSLSLRPFSFFSLVGFVSYQQSRATLDEIGETIQNRQLFIGFGGRFRIPLIRWMEWHLGGGGMNVRYHEDAFNGSVEGAKTGFYADTGLMFRLMKPLHLRLNLRYSQAETKMVDRETYGGLSLGLLLGLAF